MSNEDDLPLTLGASVEQTKAESSSEERAKQFIQAAIFAATHEVVSEQRAEILRRAKAKLTAQGAVFKDGDLEK